MRKLIIILMLFCGVLVADQTALTTDYPSIKQKVVGETYQLRRKINRIIDKVDAEVANTAKDALTVTTLTVTSATDGTATITAGGLSGVTTLAATTVNATYVSGNTLTDGTASLASGALSGITTAAITTASITNLGANLDCQAKNISDIGTLGTMVTCNLQSAVIQVTTSSATVTTGNTNIVVYDSAGTAYYIKAHTSQ